MIFIPPKEIASKIMTLFDYTEKELIIVSPYINIENWSKMKKTLENVVNKNINIDIYLRENAKNKITALIDLNINPFYITDLHAKCYINENKAIITSQNLIQYSDEFSIDIAYETESEKEYFEVRDYINRYIIPSSNKNSSDIPSDKIGNKNNETEKSIESEEIDKETQYLNNRTLYNELSNSFSRRYFKKARGYIFSGNLVDYCDLMINKTFTLKLYRRTETCDQIIKLLDNMNDDFINSKFKLKIDLEPDYQYGYYYFEPLQFESTEILAQDYTILINKLQKLMTEVVF